MTEQSNAAPPTADANRASSPYRVRLEVFEGPLDLLLHLIRKNELDVFNIPIALIIEQYLEYVDFMKELDLEVAGEFIVMAATLVHVKTRMMLPRPPDELQTVGELVDPRQELVQRLIEHQRYKAAATSLYEREIIQDRIWSRPASAIPPLAEDGETLLEVTLFDLLATLKEIIDRARGRLVIEVEPERFSVNDKIQLLADLLSGASSIEFAKLFEEARSRREIIVTFLALLEMIRLRMVRVMQGASFGPIWVFRRGSESPAKDPVP